MLALSTLPLVAALSARPQAPEPRHVLEVYVPNRTQEGDEVLDHAVWVERIASVLTDVGGGCTILPPAVGLWRNPATRELVREETTVVRVYATREALLEGGPKLRSELAQFKREAEQGAVAMTLDGNWLELVG